MVNFFPGFIVPESAQIMAKMFDRSPRAAGEVSQRSDYQREQRRWEAAESLSRRLDPRRRRSHRPHRQGRRHRPRRHRQRLRRHHQGPRAARRRLDLSADHAGAAQPRLQARRHPQDHERQHPPRHARRGESGGGDCRGGQDDESAIALALGTIGHLELADRLAVVHLQQVQQRLGIERGLEEPRAAVAKQAV